MNMSFDMYEQELEKFLLEFATSRVFLIALAAVAAVLVLGVLSYVFHAVGLSKIAKRRVVSGRWMAWFPLLDLWLLGNVCDRYLMEVKGKESHKRKTLLGLTIALLALGVISGILGFAAGFMAGMEMAVGLWLAVAVLVISVASLVLAVILLVQNYIVYYHIYYSCNPDGAAVLTVFSVLFPVIIPFVMFALRNKVNGMPPSKIR